MSITAWRIITRQYLSSAISGEGARLYGGRWNPKGVRMVYTAAHRSLAVLEMLVQDQPLRAQYLLLPVLLPDAAVAQLAPDKLQKNWRAAESVEKLRAIGAEWIASRDSVALQVPSVILPGESNYLLNPEHPDFTMVTTGLPEQVDTDSRLLAKMAKPAG